MPMNDGRNPEHVDRDSWELDRHHRFVYGRMAETLGRPRSAFAYYRGEIEATGYYKAHYNLGCLLLARGRLPEAREAFTAAARRAGSDRALAAAAWNNLGVAHQRSGEARTATAAWRIASRLAPRDPTPFVNLGMQALRDGKRSRGLALLQHALRLRTRDPLTRRWVGYALIEWELDARRGVSLLEAARKVWGRDARLLADLSLGHMQLQHLPLARQLVDRAMKIDPHDAVVRRQAAVLRGRRRPSSGNRAAVSA
jgi:tetratricopeptide (TPR) repeat protein